MNNYFWFLERKDLFSNCFFKPSWTLKQAVSELWKATLRGRTNQLNIMFLCICSANIIVDSCFAQNFLVLLGLGLFWHLREIGKPQARSSRKIGVEGAFEKILNSPN